MKQTENSVLYVGVDVDDKNFNCCGIEKETGELFYFKTRPTAGDLVKALKKFQQKGYELKVCYEASYLGFSLHRELKKKGIESKVVAASLIPQKPGCAVKTDRVDCIRLAEYLAKDLLTAVHVPDEEDEQVRDLIRARSFLVKQRKAVKVKILSVCRRYGIHYKTGEERSAQYWTKKHLEWLQGKIKESSLTLKIIFKSLLEQLSHLDAGIEELERVIQAMAQKDRYRRKAEALNCFRGLDTLSSMTLITELGDIHRFSHPKCLTSYSGMEIREYSSGGKEKKMGITKQGNTRVRTTVIEACQKIRLSLRPSKRLQAARKNQEPEIIAIADRCTKRLQKKSRQMQIAGKHLNKIKVACGREMLGFVWEALRMVS